MTAEQFKEYWDSTGLKQKELAELLGVQQSRISEWAKNDNIPEYIQKQIELRKKQRHLEIRMIFDPIGYDVSIELNGEEQYSACRDIFDGHDIEKSYQQFIADFVEWLNQWKPKSMS